MKAQPYFIDQFKKVRYLVAYVSSEGSGETAHLRSLARAFENRAKKMGYRGRLSLL